jgi:hypothetical protein
VKTKNTNVRLANVFDHDAEPGNVQELRSAVADDLHWLRNSFSKFGKVTAAELDPLAFRQLRERYRLLLHFGVFSLPGKRALANELIWKWTEATGKYTGCQFWSVRAKSLFDREVQSAGGWPITARLAKTLEKKLSTKSVDGKPKLSDAKLTHEHVYPIKDVKLLLSGKDGETPEGIRNLLDLLCVSCVVLESEHDRLSGHERNPWLRYKNAGIRLVENPAWPDRQRSLILQAGILQ